MKSTMKVIQIWNEIKAEETLSLIEKKSALFDEKDEEKENKSIMSKKLDKQ
jgi:hypothetical protein